MKFGMTRYGSQSDEQRARSPPGWLRSSHPPQPSWRISLRSWRGLGVDPGRLSWLQPVCALTSIAPELAMAILPVDKENLRRQYQSAEPFPFVKIDNLLEPAFADEVAQSYPSYDTAAGLGKSFKTVNERRKVQITDAKLFPEPAQRLSQVLASPEFLATLSHISGIPNLLADDDLIGGGLHVTGPGGRLDVHVDFNFLEARNLHRRINLLLYLNPVWDDRWGGHVQLWDRDVKRCRHDFSPRHNRCVIFETSEISYHGVTPVAPETPVERRSFAAYYYTREPPPHWKGSFHSTIFRARPDERMRGLLWMPVEKLQRKVSTRIDWAKHEIKRALGGLRR
jgi:hypothetical protein